MMQAVEKATGFKVMVDTVDGIDEDAEMISARPESPMHLIRVNRARLAHAEYIVAMQCAMILRFWSDPARIPVFAPSPEKIRYLADRSAKSEPLRNAPAALAQSTALKLVTGLVHQLRSMPLEIQVVRDCYSTCPDLLPMQIQSIDSTLRRLSENFSPKVRSVLPDQPWRQSVSMSAAFALNWSELQDYPLAMLIYKTTGFSAIARQLLDEAISRPGKSSESYTQLVDAWARILNLQNLYTWEYRNGLL